MVRVEGNKRMSNQKREGNVEAIGIEETNEIVRK